MNEFFKSRLSFMMSRFCANRGFSAEWSRYVFKQLDLELLKPSLCFLYSALWSISDPTGEHQSEQRDSDVARTRPAQRSNPGVRHQILREGTQRTASELWTTQEHCTQSSRKRRVVFSKRQKKNLAPKREEHKTVSIRALKSLSCAVTATTIELR